MKQAEFTFPSDFEKIEAALLKISQSGLFEVEEDHLGKSTPQKMMYRILMNRGGSQQMELVGLLEITWKKDRVIGVKIREQYATKHDSLPETGSPLTRFVGMFSQHLMTDSH